MHCALTPLHGQHRQHCPPLHALRTVTVKAKTPNSPLGSYQKCAAVRNASPDRHSRPVEVHEGEVRLPTHTSLGQKLCPRHQSQAFLHHCPGRAKTAVEGAYHLARFIPAVVSVAEAQLPIVVAPPALDPAVELRPRPHLSGTIHSCTALVCPNPIRPGFPFTLRRFSLPPAFTRRPNPLIAKAEIFNSWYSLAE